MSLPKKIILETTFSEKCIDTVPHKHVLHVSGTFVLYNQFQTDGTGWQTKSFPFKNLDKAIKYFMKKVAEDKKCYRECQNMDIIHPHLNEKEESNANTNAQPSEPIKAEKFPNWKDEVREIEEINSQYFGVLSSTEWAFYRFITACGTSNYKTAIEAFPKFYERVLEHARSVKKRLSRGE